MELKSPEDIYASVSNEVDVILAKLKTLSSDKEIASAKEKAEEIFGALSVELKDNIESLKRNAEWNTFTIAFYGETNAGKSTIIETMRMMLQEPGKVKQQAEFKALQERLGITPARLEAMAAAVAEAEQKTEKLQQELDQADAAHSGEIQRLGAQIKVLQEIIQEHKQAASLWQKLLDVFIKRPEEKQSQALAIELRTRENTRRVETASLQQQHADAQQKQEASKQVLAEANASMAQLAQHADGAIIGKGGSDFTRDSTAYEFSANHQKFALLDLPGIEGKEALILDGVWAGVKKAHAVFYVTGKAAAPQKGDGTHAGTLEKIKQQLGAQTEVWTIYNKRVTNPIALQKAKLVDDGEEESLRDVDEKMASVLGDNYRGHLALSAFPAFLASATCLLPESDDARNKAKFGAKYSEDELLKRSGMTEFHDIVVDKLVQDSKAKIVRSNFNKAHGVVADATGRVSSTLKDSFKPLASQLAKDAAAAQKQLDMSFDALRGRLISQGESAATEFTESVRSAIYRKIDDDISNDDFKDDFERIIRRKREALVESLPDMMQGEIRKFQEQINSVVERFESFATDLMDTYSNLSNTSFGEKFDLKIKLDNGINTLGLLSALAGGAMLVWNPAGWVMLALGAAGLVVGAWKALRGFFSSDFKKSEQRKSADSNLSNIDSKLRESLRETLDAALPQLQPKLDAVKEALDRPAQQIEQMATLLGQAERQLKNISKTIKTEGAL
ncbi:hypothetical protein ABT364_25485 [Massilia sp. SR12]